MRTARIAMPKTARKGDIVEIKTLIIHPMETGFRRDDVGRPVPRDIIGLFTVTYAGTEVFRMDLFPGVAASIKDSLKNIAETGEFVFTWTDDKGVAHVEKMTLTVS